MTMMETLQMSHTTKTTTSTSTSTSTNNIS
jgi:hypothetical protein